MPVIKGSDGFDLGKLEEKRALIEQTVTIEPAARPIASC